MDLESEVLIGPGSIPTGAIFLDQFGWERSNLNVWNTRCRINFL